MRTPVPPPATYSDGYSQVHSVGADGVIAAAFILGKHTCSAGTGRPRLGISREGLQDGGAGPGSEPSTRQGAVGLASDN
jgi:hypothetical protein